jgi:tripartite-type tricarboxylate transporter receptor subunit TctC
MLHLALLPKGHFMKFPRRHFLRLAAGCAALPVVSRIAQAQAYPTRPARILVGFPPSSAADILARVLGQGLSERLGQPFVVETQPGAGSNIATEAVVRAHPDGYTLLMVTGSNAVNATLYDKLNFNFIRDIAPVARVSRGALIMVVNPSVPATTVPEFIAYAKANAGRIKMASGGNGGTTHVVGELFKVMTGVDMRHVPYRGSPAALVGVIEGQAHVMFDLVPPLIESVKSGKLRVLAVSAAQRLEVLPDVPTVGDFVPGYEATFWGGIGVPTDTPAEIIDQLSQEINAVLADPTVKARIADVGYTVFASSPGDFGKFIAAETEKWAKIVKLANIRAE